jgi:hypothetical protein
LSGLLALSEPLKVIVPSIRIVEPAWLALGWRDNFPVIALLIVSFVPTIVTSVAVSAPALVTRNGAAEAVLLPAKNGNVPGKSPTADDPVPAVSDVELRVKPPMVPAVAVIAPAFVTE